ncbi:MAG: hypothetical protein P1U78_12870 [Alcanivoracaceae bacterium]|nr:hypothetical protein [Alcanivoracaceae bacterium]
MRFPRRTMLSAWLIPAMLSMSATLYAAEGTVIIARDCDYVLLDSQEGQILIKMIKGERPKTGDKLAGKLERGFSELTNKRTSETMKVWVDQVDPSGSKALMHYSQYCN